YIDFEGGINSIINSTLQFSHPLSFRDESHPLGDKSEFWYDRLYIDLYTLQEYIYELENIYNKKINLIEAFNLLIYQSVMNTLERNKVLCLSVKNNNIHLKKMYPTGICIEYDTNLFKNKSHLINNYSKETIIYNKVHYVDEIIPYPVRL